MAPPFDLEDPTDLYTPAVPDYSSIGSRDDLIGAYSNILSQARLQQQRAIQSLYTDDDVKMSGGAAAASALLGLLPIAIGAAMHGTAGASMGAQAGLVAASPLLAQEDKNRQLQQKKQELNLQVANENYKNAATELGALEKSKFAADDQQRYLDKQLQNQKDVATTKFGYDMALADKRGQGSRFGDMSGDEAFEKQKQSVAESMKSSSRATDSDVASILSSRNFDELDKAQKNIQARMRIGVGDDSLHKGNVMLGDKFVQNDSNRIIDRPAAQQIIDQEKTRNEFLQMAPAVKNVYRNIGMYQNMLTASPEERQKASEEIGRVRNFLLFSRSALAKGNAALKGNLSNTEQQFLSSVLPEDIRTDFDVLKTIAKFSDNAIGSVDALTEQVERDWNQTLQNYSLSYKGGTSSLVGQDRIDRIKSLLTGGR